MRVCVEKIKVSLSALVPKRPQTLANPWSSKFSMSLSNKQPRILQFFFFLRSIHTLHLAEKYWEVHCNPKAHCPIGIRVKFLFTKMLVLWVCTFLEVELGVLELYHLQKVPSRQKHFYLEAQYLIKCKTYCFKSLELKMEG